VGRSARYQGAVPALAVENVNHPILLGLAGVNVEDAFTEIVEYGDWIRPLRSSAQRFARALDDGAEKTRALELVAAA
jgi:hypothetical protein